ncbi:MAG: hypothetical protein V1872_12440 [bacterium]
MDFMRHLLSVYDLEGRFAFEFGGEGTRANFFNFPKDVCNDDEGRVFVADTFNHRIQVFELINSSGRK